MILWFDTKTFITPVLTTQIQFRYCHECIYLHILRKNSISRKKRLNFDFMILTVWWVILILLIKAANKRFSEQIFWILITVFFFEQLWFPFLTFRKNKQKAASSGPCLPVEFHKELTYFWNSINIFRATISYCLPFFETSSYFMFTAEVCLI